MTKCQKNHSTLYITCTFHQINTQNKHFYDNLLQPLWTINSINRAREREREGDRKTNEHVFLWPVNYHHCKLRHSVNIFPPNKYRISLVQITFGAHFYSELSLFLTSIISRHINYIYIQIPSILRQHIHESCTKSTICREFNRKWSITFWSIQWTIQYFLTVDNTSILDFHLNYKGLCFKWFAKKIRKSTLKLTHRFC